VSTAKVEFKTEKFDQAAAMKKIEGEYGATSHTHVVHYR
jgi:hypothetical protein